MELTPLLRGGDLSLPRLFRWEAEGATRIDLTQPLVNGESRDYSWAQTLDEARRMAAHLRSFGWPAGSCIAILSKNCAQWLIADFAIWIAGHVSVPIYPTLAATSIRQILVHSQAKAIFIGKLDGWDAMAPGIGRAACWERGCPEV